MKPLVVLYAKAPVPGRVKTRLIPVLGAEGACTLHERLVSEALGRLHEIEPYADVELHTDVATAAWPEFRGTRGVQIEGTLGEKIYATLGAALSAGRPRVAVIGSDSPGLPRAVLLSFLESASDVRLGPAEDGGYYAISAKQTRPAMFDSVRWSTSDALADTVAACARCGLSVELASSWFDIDTPADLARFENPLK